MERPAPAPAGAARAVPAPGHGLSERGAQNHQKNSSFGRCFPIIKNNTNMEKKLRTL